MSEQIPDPMLDPDADLTETAVETGSVEWAETPTTGTEPSPEPSEDGVLGAPIHMELGDYLDPEADEFEPPDADDVFITADGGIPDDVVWDAVPEGAPVPTPAPITESSTEGDLVAAMGEGDFATEDAAEEEAADGDPVSYEIQGRPGDADPFTPWRTLAVVDATEDTADLYGLPVGAEWQFRVRAIFEDGTPGDWSADALIDLPSDMLAPSVPTVPVVYDYAGLLIVEWDGLSADGPMPPDFKHVVVWHSPTGQAGTWTAKGLLFNKGQFSITGLEIGAPHYIALSARDLTGNESVRTASASITLAPIIDVPELRDELARIDELYGGVLTDAGQLDERLADAEAELTAAKERLAETEADLNTAVTVTIPQAVADLTSVDAAISEAAGELTRRLDEDIPQAIDAAAASPITDSRLVAGSLNVWPFKPGVMPPGSIGSGDIADFSIAVRKFKSDRHHMY